MILSFRLILAGAALTTSCAVLPAAAPAQTGFAGLGDKKLESLCNYGNNAAACNAFGSAHIKADDSGDVAGAMVALEHGCDDLKNALSCYTIGVAFMGIDRVTEQDDEADRYLTEACRMGVRAGCTKYAEFQQIKTGNAKEAEAEAARSRNNDYGLPHRQCHQELMSTGNDGRSPIYRSVCE